MSWEKITPDNVEAVCAKQRAELDDLRARMHRAEDALLAELDASNAKRIAAADPPIPESVLAEWRPIEREQRRVSRLQLDAWIDTMTKTAEGQLELVRRQVENRTLQ